MNYIYNMSTKKNTAVYKTNKKTSRRGGKKSQKRSRKNRRTKKGGNQFDIQPDAIGQPIAAGYLNDNYVGRILRWPEGQEAGEIIAIQPMNGAVRVFFNPNHSYQYTRQIDINNDQTVYIQ